MAPAGQANRLLIIIAVMSATFMQVLDTTIVNVALPYMAGELSATPDQISWVLTSYLVASAVFIPLTGYFTDRFGQRRFLLICMSGFVIASGLCGMATSLEQIVIFRVLQGVLGASLIPLSQSIMLQVFTSEERGRAMGIWGMGVMVGPILGPTLGGYLTEVLNWRATFFINLPIGAVSILLALRTVPDTPKRARPLDWTGFVLLFLGIGGLQFVIDRGNQEDWFESSLIQTVAALSVFGLLAFVFRSLRDPTHALIDIRLFRDRNFTTATTLVSLFCVSMFAAIVLTPIFLENLLGYPADTAGWLMAPRGIASLFSMVWVGRMVNHVPPRRLAFIGLALWTLGSFPMAGYNLNVSIWFLVWPAVIQGFALGFVFVPMATLAYATVPRQSMAEAAGLYNLCRTVGSSLGISIIATIMTRQTQVAWSETGSHIHSYNPAVNSYLGRLGLDITDPQAPGVLVRELARQAQMIGMVDAFAAIAWSFLLMLPFALLLHRGFPHRDAAGPSAAAVSE